MGPCGGSRLLRLLLGACLLRQPGAESPGCKLEGWASERPAPGGGEDGYHVVCALSASEALVYQGGVASEEPLRTDLVSDSGQDVLRESLGRVLRFPGNIVYQDPAKGRKLEWKRRPWVLYTTKGARLPVGKEGAALAKFFSKRKKPVTLLMFEGGAWRWPTIREGYVRPVMQGINLITVSRQPALFEVVIDLDKVAEGDGDELSIELLSDVVDVAEPKLLASAAHGKDRTSQQTFLDYDTDPKLQQLRWGSAVLARLPQENFEHLQVVRYETDQYYDAHRDYWDPREFPNIPQFTGRDGYWNQRHATLLWYLRPPGSGGQTWFPRAHGLPIPEGEWLACDSRGASVHPHNATAVLFYSLKADGDIDEFSWHSGCPVLAGVKWAANSWIRNGPLEPPRPPAKRRKSTLKEL